MNLSGGESLCYPYLCEIIKCGSELGIHMNVATSGYTLDGKKLDDLVEAGIDKLFISLNGSTEEINSLTRDGYHLSIKALELLSKQHFPRICINWVMHSNNAYDFPEVLKIAEKFNVSKLVVLSFKPDSHNAMKSYPDKEQIMFVSRFIKTYKGNVKILIETCFSPLLAYISESKLLGNMNRGLFIGCGAGRWSYNVNVDGMYSPCRHLDYFENCSNIEEYWENSSVLKKLRDVENDTREPCQSCKFAPNCRHCMAINSKLHGEIYRGFELCDLCEE